jgi:hypothetical protein
VTESRSSWFSWRPWWCPVDEDPPITLGFLDDPTGPFAAYFDYSLVELAHLDHVRCLVLLGEAGMGKSSELGAEERRLHSAQLPVVKFDLRAEPDVSSLRDTMLTSAEVTAWLAHADDLVMLLDGFDEANASLGKLPDQLMKLLDGLPIDRLKLRITSRTGVWSPRLDAGLADRWPDLQRWVLAPLTEENVRVAALGRAAPGPGRPHPPRPGGQQRTGGSSPAAGYRARPSAGSAPTGDLLASRSTSQRRAAWSPPQHTVFTVGRLKPPANAEPHDGPVLAAPFSVGSSIAALAASAFRAGWMGLTSRLEGVPVLARATATRHH